MKINYYFFTDLKPTKDGKQFYLWNPKWGMYKEKEAELIAEFIRKNLPYIIDKCVEK